ncbi:hypothetical protein NDU88_009625 [Pleurodeles waltl]|uniref:Uncharacterized protein n=1 Tax=Pleurodeles waltl TaxID=8319 RepID=A0AAV7PVH7_PLEWA|nr:hypothetical protein NDU88_009625 [Pleurodeles waltl]
MATEHIPQEIAAVGRRLEAMDTKITDSAMDSKSIQMDIASFQDRVTELDHCFRDVDGRLNAVLGRDQELQFLRNKLTDLAYRNWSDNVSFFGIPERKESTDVRAFLWDFLPELIGLVFSPTLELQWAHRMPPPIKTLLGNRAPS